MRTRPRGPRAAVSRGGGGLNHRRPGDDSADAVAAAALFRGGRRKGEDTLRVAVKGAPLRPRSEEGRSPPSRGGRGDSVAEATEWRMSLDVPVVRSPRGPLPPLSAQSCEGRVAAIPFGE